MVTESEVTVALARSLVERELKILSIALPGGGSGLTFRSDLESAPTIVPDLVAKFLDGKVLIVEAKPKFHGPDVQKLLNLVSGSYDTSISKSLGKVGAELLTAIAVSYTPNLQKFSQDKDFLDFIFLVDDEKQVQVAHDKNNLLKNGESSFNE